MGRDLFWAVLIFALFQGRSDVNNCPNFLPEQLQMLIHDLGFTSVSILFIFSILDVFDLRSLVQLIYPEAKEPSKFVQKFFENEVRVDFTLAMSRKLTKHVSVLVLQQEIVPIVYPLEIHVERDFFLDLMV